MQSFCQFINIEDIQVFWRIHNTVDNLQRSAFAVKAGANASNISSNIENFACCMKCWMHLRGVKFFEKGKKKKKIVLDDVG